MLFALAEVTCKCIRLDHETALSLENTTPGDHGLCLLRERNGKNRQATSEMQETVWFR